MDTIKTINQWIEKILGEDHDYYSCHLPKHTGYISRFFLQRIFSGISISPDVKTIIEKIPEEAVVIYVSKHKSSLEFLFYNIRYSKEKLPYPQTGFDCTIYAWQPVTRLFKIMLSSIHSFLSHMKMKDPYEIGFFSSQIEKGRTCFLPLLEKREFYRRFLKSKTDPIRRLINIQDQIQRPIYIIPQLIFFGKKPAPHYPTLTDIIFGNIQDPGILRQLFILMRKPDHIFVEASDPINIKAYLEQRKNQGKNLDQLAHDLRQDLIHQINSHRKSITGPTIKSHEEINQAILTSNHMRTFMEGYAKRRKQSIWKTHKEALKYIDEISARYSPGFVSLAYKVTGRFLGMMFEGVTLNREALATIKSMSRKGPVILVPCHKSHIDYLIMSYTLYDNNLPAPHTFAGKNLSFWPMGPLFRRAGAFFVRRTFKGAVFYSKVFSTYIFRLLKEGFNIEVFIEGTRSRSGKLLRPQLGMLSILLNAFKAGACSDLVFAPVSIGYDRTPDEGSYLHETSGGSKKPENFRQMLRAKKLIKKRYGRIYIKFDTPFSLNEMMAEEGLRIGSITPKQLNMVCRNLGSRLMKAIDRNTIVTPRALVAGVLLTETKDTITETELMFRVDASLKLFSAGGAKLTGALLEDYMAAVNGTLTYYADRKFISIVEKQGPNEDKETSYKVIPGKRVALEYYKNNCIIFYIPAAFTALAILEKDAFQFASTDLHNTYRMLRELFSFEFNPDLARPPEYKVRKTIKAFIDDAILTPHRSLPDTYNLSSEGYRKLKFFAGFTHSFFESYKTTLSYFSKTPTGRHNKDKRPKKVQSLGTKMLKRGEISLKESISTLNYANAIDYFVKNGIRGSEDAEKIMYWNQIIEKYLAIITR